jgi:hypothetical protein
VEEKIVKSITEVMIRIDDKEGRNVGRGISEKREGGVQCGHRLGVRRTPDASQDPLTQDFASPAPAFRLLFWE